MLKSVGVWEFGCMGVKSFPQFHTPILPYATTLILGLQAIAEVAGEHGEPNTEH